MARHGGGHEKGEDMKSVEKFISAHPWAVVLGTAIVLFLIGQMYGKKSAQADILALAKSGAKSGDYGPLFKALGVESTPANAKMPPAAAEEEG